MKWDETRGGIVSYSLWLRGPVSTQIKLFGNEFTNQGESYV